MRRIPKPTLRAESVLLDCAATITDVDLQRRVRRQKSRVVAAERVYCKRGRKAKLYEIIGTAGVGSVRAAEMVWLYDKKLSRKNDRARQHYDTLQAAAPNNLCPFCSAHTVKTLDHFLAKTTHPVYAVTPLNLVPSCFDCNHAKLAHAPADAGEQILHPYFDNADTATWLTANVVPGRPPGVSYAVRLPSHWNRTKQRRLKTHFELLGLAALYASQAGSMMAALKYAFRAEHRASGATGLRRFLRRQARYIRQSHRNAWLAAMFTALAESNWFCRIGHRCLVTG